MRYTHFSSLTRLRRCFCSLELHRCRELRGALVAYYAKRELELKVAVLQCPSLTDSMAQNATSSCAVHMTSVTLALRFLLCSRLPLHVAKGRDARLYARYVAQTGRSPVTKQSLDHLTASGVAQCHEFSSCSHKPFVCVPCPLFPVTCCYVENFISQLFDVHEGNYILSCAGFHAYYVME